jgi:hypothetical protein
MKRTALIASVLLSIVMTIILWNSCPMVVKGVDDLVHAYDYRNRSWILQHGIFSLSFGLVPFCSFLIWRFGQYSTALSLIVHSLFTWTISLAASSFAFILFIRGYVLNRSYMPQSNLNLNLPQPAWREQMMNVAVPLSVILPLLILFCIAVYQRKKSTNVGVAQEIDQ